MVKFATGNCQRTHFMFKLSPTCSHTRSKSLSQLSSYFINSITRRIQLIPITSNALSWLTESLISVFAVSPRSCSPGFMSRPLNGHTIGGVKSGITTLKSPTISRAWCPVTHCSWNVKSGSLLNSAQKIYRKQYLATGGSLAIHLNSGITEV